MTSAIAVMPQIGGDAAGGDAGQLVRIAGGVVILLLAMLLLAAGAPG